MTRSLAGIVGCLAVSAGAGCTQAEEQQVPRFWPVAEDPRVATQAETSRLLINGDLRELAGTVDARRPIFYPNGRYVQVGYATVEGYYTVDGNVFCMSIGRNDLDRRCRAINITPTGPVIVPVNTSLPVK